MTPGRARAGERAGRAARRRPLRRSACRRPDPPRARRGACSPAVPGPAAPRPPEHDLPGRSPLASRIPASRIPASRIPVRPLLDPTLPDPTFLDRTSPAPRPTRTRSPHLPAPGLRPPDRCLPARRLRGRCPPGPTPHRRASPDRHTRDPGRSTGGAPRLQARRARVTMPCQAHHERKTPGRGGARARGTLVRARLTLVRRLPGRPVTGVPDGPATRPARLTVSACSPRPRSTRQAP